MGPLLHSIFSSPFETIALKVQTNLLRLYLILSFGWALFYSVAFSLADLRLETYAFFLYSCLLAVTFSVMFFHKNHIARHLFLASTFVTLMTCAYHQASFIFMFWLILLPFFAVTLNAKNDMFIYGGLTAAALTLLLSPYFTSAFNAPAKARLLFEASFGSKEAPLSYLSVISFIVLAIYAAYQSRNAAHLSREEAEKNINHLLNALPDATVIINPKGYILWANELISQLLGFPYEAIAGKAFSVFGSDKLERFFIRKSEQIFSSSSAHHPSCQLGSNYNLFLVHQDGRKVPVEIRVSNYYHYGKRYLLVSIRELLQEQPSVLLRQARTIAKRAFHMKNLYLARAAHDLRSPICSILGFSDLALEDDIEEKERLYYIEAIRRNSTYLLELLNDLLDLSSIEAGKLALKLEALDLKNEVQEIVSSLQALAHKKDLTLSLSWGEGLPKEICTDAKRLRQALNNVIFNALKSTTKGYVSIYISYETGGNRHKPRICFKISDTGEGIAKQDQSKIFLPFGQSDVPSEKSYRGSSLGLALARHLARKMGGDLILQESIEKKGSVFILTIDPGPTAAMPGEKV